MLRKLNNVYPNLITALTVIVISVFLSSCASMNRYLPRYVRHNILKCCHCWPPKINSVYADNITATSAIIHFDVDSTFNNPHDYWWQGVPSGADPNGGTGQVYYGTDIAKGTLYPPTTPTTIARHHDITLTGLTPNTVYNYCPYVYSWFNGTNVIKTDGPGPVLNDQSPHYAWNYGNWTFQTLPSGAVYTVSGYVLDSGASPIQGVNVRISGSASRNYSTTASGYYEFNNLSAGNYTITPSKTGTNFSPGSLSYSPLGASQSNQNFTGFQNIAPYEPKDLKAEGAVNPVDLTNFYPALSWTFSDPNAGNTQGAYRILVADNAGSLGSDTGNMLDTGKINSASSSAMYNGSPLQRGGVYYWKVMTWDNNDAPSQFSGTGQFSMSTSYVNSALHFTRASNSSATCPISPSLNLNGTGLTIEAWIYFNNISSNFDLEVLVGTDVRDNRSYTIWDGFMGYNNGEQWRFGLVVGSIDYEINASRNLAANTWYHMAGTYDGSTIRFFINGELQGSAALTGGTDITTSNNPWYIGCRSPGSETLVDAVVDEIRISDIARYTSNFTPPSSYFTADANTRGLWHMDEGSGVMTNDSSGGNSFSLTNVQWATGYPFSGGGSSDSITISVPNGGEIWQAGTIKTVTWSSVGSGNVNIDLTTNGTNWTSLAQNINNTGSHSVAVPLTTSSNCLIRVAGVSGTPSDVSDNSFTISPSMSNFISGYVNDISNNPVAYVTMNLTGTGSATCVTNTAGYYEFPNLTLGNYTVTPHRNGAAFSPSSLSINLNSGLSNQNFSATLYMFNINGYTRNPGNNPLNSVRVVLSGKDSSDLYYSSTTYSDSSGYYEFTKLLPGNYNIIPSNNGYSFSPLNLMFTEINTDKYNQNFTGTNAGILHMINGHVTDRDVTGKAITDARVSLSGDNSSIYFSNDTGYYEFRNLVPGNYTITPTKAGYSFTPKNDNVQLMSDYIADFKGVIAFGPILDVDLKHIDFGEIVPDIIATASFTITNIGIGTLTGTIVSDQAWLTVSDNSFSSNNTTIYVYVDYENYAAALSGSAILTIVTNGGSEVIDVSVYATCVLAKPNPYSTRKGNLKFYGDGVIPFNTKIMIYALDGKPVRTLNETKGLKEISWDGKDENNQEVSSGIYLYAYQSPKEKGIGKFSVVSGY